ncbi:hypothetical protein RHSIM_Rhsim06G0077900 [Rhododendron simsii]|uniref:DDE Tnp4 domain-containing protein n=1 Tax=Rhododendron simsii TaxID=118357 RepID=A0A834GYL1_RHOSS|nr:hypothetical protein RHSIM_Rhsim06G0077900 [Rhododendron simsii]
MYQSFHMSKTNFFALCELLESKYGLEEGERISVQEQVAIFLWIVGQGANNRNAQERFQHSGETISRHFHNVLQNAMAIEWIKPWPWPREEVHSKILGNSKYYPHFANYIGAIDGTHIKAHPELEQLLRWIGRKGYPTQNIMAVCDFAMCFTFALTRWEGSAHDARIFNDCLRNPYFNFSVPRGDEFYLVDAEYPNT